MWKLRIAAAAAACLLALVTGGAALAASAGDANAGDVWLDNVGQPMGPGHEHDPHLGCSDIVIYGSDMADAGGSWTVYGWPPTGSKQADLTGGWSYDQTTGGGQQIATISVSDLIAGAQANGDTPHNQQGYHFKLAVSQDPHKYKTFWVNCSSSSASSAAHTTTTTSTTTAPAATTAPTNSAVKGVSIKRHRRHRRHHRRRHRRLVHRALIHRGFTG